MESYDTAIIGNGFDLYYDQPTRYEDFYNFMKDINNMSLSQIESYYNNSKIEEYYDYLKKQIDSNIFLIYFIKYNQLYDSWNAFEDELLKLLEGFDEMLKSIEEDEYSRSYQHNDKIFINVYSVHKCLDVLEIIKECNLFTYEEGKEEGIPYRRLIIPSNLPLDSSKKRIKEKVKKYVDNFPKKLYLELEEFCNVFKMYLKIFLLQVNHKKLDKDISVYKIINYNYTDIANKIFDPSEGTCYIHGNIKKDIVLGIDSKHVKLNRFFYFTKEMQKIDKKTDYNLLDDIALDSNSILIIGHSLNEADDESLKVIFKNEYISKICIYYYSKDRFSNMNLANNIKRILGQKRFSNYLNSGVLEFRPLPD